MIVEDDRYCADRLISSLSTWDIPGWGLRFKIDFTETVEEARKYLKRDLADIYIVDLGLSEAHNRGVSEEVGKRFVREIVNKSNAGIIVYSSMPAEVQEAASLADGADDYIQKIEGTDDEKQRNSIETRIRARVLSVWRRVALTRPTRVLPNIHGGRVFKIGDWKFVIGNRTLQNEKGNELKLSQTEHAFLRYLCTEEKNDIDLKEFNEAILQRESSEHVSRLDNFIYRLRSKLGESVQLISTRDGRYVLTSVLELKSI